MAPGQSLVVDAANGNSPYAVNADDTFNSVTVGNTGVGVINHNAGTLTVSSGLTLGSSAGSNGTYNLNGGTVQVANLSRGSGTGTFNFNGGTLAISDFTSPVIQGLTTASVQAGGATIYNGNSFPTIAQSLTSGTAGNTPDGGLKKTGPGNLVLSGNNSYTGGTTFAGGSLTVGSAGALGSTGTLTFTGGTLAYGTGFTTDYSDRFSAAANQAYSISSGGQGVTLAAPLTSSGGTLTYRGPGTLVVAGENTYDGGTTFAGGSLNVGSDGALGTTGPLTFAGGALQYSAANTTDYSDRFFDGAKSGVPGGHQRPERDFCQRANRRGRQPDQAWHRHLDAGRGEQLHGGSHPQRRELELSECAVAWQRKRPVVQRRDVAVYEREHDGLLTALFQRG